MGIAGGSPRDFQHQAPLLCQGGRWKHYLADCKGIPGWLFPGRVCRAGAVDFAGNQHLGWPESIQMASTGGCMAPKLGQHQRLARCCVRKPPAASQCIHERVHERPKSYLREWVHTHATSRGPRANSWSGLNSASEQHVEGEQDQVEQHRHQYDRYPHKSIPEGVARTADWAPGHDASKQWPERYVAVRQRRSWVTNTWQLVDEDPMAASSALQAPPKRQTSNVRLAFQTRKLSKSHLHGEYVWAQQPSQWIAMRAGPWGCRPAVDFASRWRSPVRVQDLGQRGWLLSQVAAARNRRPEAKTNFPRGFLDSL